MALDKALIAFKKLFNRPHTTPLNPLLANEGDSVGFPSDTSQIFGRKVPTNPPTGSFYELDNSSLVEKIRLPLEFIPGTDSTAGRHAFYAKLPTDYEASSSNPKAGTYPWINDQVLAFTTGSIQIVSQFSGGRSYQLILRNSASAQIPALDPREWFGYEFGGMVYQETPPGTGNDVENPAYLDCYLYIGPMADELIASGSSSSGSNIAFESQGVELTPTAVRVNFTGSGVSGSVTSDSGGDEVTYTIPGVSESTASIDYRQILFLADCGPFENFNNSMFHSYSYEPGTPFVSASIWYTDLSQSGKIFEIDYGTRNSNKQAEEIVYTVYGNDGLTVKTQMKDIVTYNGPIEINRTRIIL